MKVLIFNLTDKQYALEISQVREVVRMKKPVPVPDAAEFVEGVISLRGKVITLINLRKKLGFEGPAPDKKSRIIIVQADAQSLGIIVDRVVNVNSVAPEQVTQPDNLLKEAGYLAGVVKLDNSLVLILDITRLFSDREKSDIETVRGKVHLRRRQKNG